MSTRHITRRRPFAPNTKEGFLNVYLFLTNFYFATWGFSMQPRILFPNMSQSERKRNSGGDSRPHDPKCTISLARLSWVRLVRFSTIGLFWKWKQFVANDSRRRGCFDRFLWAGAIGRSGRAHKASWITRFCRRGELSGDRVTFQT